jgi:uncharacterized protein
VTTSTIRVPPPTGENWLARCQRWSPTSFVLDEVITFFNNRGRHAKAVEIGRRVLGSPTVRLIHVDEDLFRAGFDFLARHTDKRFSLTDCTSFVVMHRMGIHEALAFDAHFEQAGFRRLPD